MEEETQEAPPLKFLSDYTVTFDEISRWGPRTECGRTVGEERSGTEQRERYILRRRLVNDTSPKLVSEVALRVDPTDSVFSAAAELSWKERKRRETEQQEKVKAMQLERMQRDLPQLPGRVGNGLLYVDTKRKCRPPWAPRPDRKWSLFMSRQQQQPSLGQTGNGVSAE